MKEIILMAGILWWLVFTYLHDRIGKIEAIILATVAAIFTGVILVILIIITTK